MRHMSDIPGEAATPRVLACHPLPLEETPDTIGAYPRLSEQQIGVLDAHGAHRSVQPGEMLFRDGDKWADFFVVLAGQVAIVEAFACPDEQLIAVHGPGRFLGELSLLTGQAALYSAVVAEPGEVLAVPVGRVRDLLAKDAMLGDLILKSYLIRRSMLIGLGTGMRIIGSRYSPDVRRLRDFAARNRLPHRWIDLESDPGTESLLRQLGVAPEDTPIVILYGKQLLRNPSNAELAAAIGQPIAVPAQTGCDLTVVGAGPAGLSAAVYGAAEGLITVALDAIATGGQAGTSSRIENYLGFPAGISGAELADRAVIQARKFGAGITVPAQATSLRQDDGQFEIGLADGGRSTAGASWSRPGRGIAGSRCPDGRIRKHECVLRGLAGRSTALPGRSGSDRGRRQLCRAGRALPGQVHGECAAAGPRTRTRGQHVPLPSRSDRQEPRDRRAVPYRGARAARQEALEDLIVEDNQTGELRQIPARALFVFIGAEPSTGWLSSEVALDEHGFVLTGPAVAVVAERLRVPDAASPRSALETSLPGLFAAGDVRSTSTKRVASAVGEGAMAIRLVHERMQFG